MQGGQNAVRGAECSEGWQKWGLKATRSQKIEGADTTIKSLISFKEHWLPFGKRLNPMGFCDNDLQLRTVMAGPRGEMKGGMER